MERTSSRRRIRQPRGDLQDPPRVSSQPAQANTSSQAAGWSRSYLASVVIFLVLVVSFLGALRIPRSPPYYSSQNRVLGPTQQQQHPGAQRLHPEAHIYRTVRTIRLNWTVTAGYRRPDGVLKRIYLVNGQFPGPVVEARSGDRLIVDVRNGLEDEGVSVHWHGLHMRDANRMDGTVGVTQCAINPGDSFRYDFTISDSQSGTYWYHAHSGLQRADGLYGGLVVHRPSPKAIRGTQSRNAESDILKYKYQKEILLLVGDWYHRPADDVLKWYMRAASYGNEPVPDSLLVNGVGRFDCARAVPARPIDCSSKTPMPHFMIDPTQSYRVRVVNTGSLAGFSLGFSQGNISLTHVDGGLDVQHFKQSKASNSKSIGILYPGQRVDFILQHHQNARGKSSLTVELDPDCFKYPNPALSSAQAIPIYNANSNNIKTYSPQPLHIRSSTHINLTQVSSTAAVLSGLPPEAQQTYVIYTKISQMSKNQNMPFGYFNQTSWRPQSDPPHPLVDLDPHHWDKNQFAISTGSKPVWVDLVVNNLDEGPHPFHLHGHNFFILTIHSSSRGWGSYNPFSPHQQHQQYRPTSMDLARALLRDTVQIPPRGHAVLRFRADNPGIWLFHCHILWHLASGMAMVFDVMNGSQTGNGHGLAGGGAMEMCRYL
ncbi:ferro-O2-oxidoreductase [Blastomyces gilchristii SLH14081]|uniref:Ferro-O2-oxidoreductase n=2 Tax=Blastomyces gilchristii (strain SLH14081) TaxID=559298 RepID=A0A179UV40_BLAGS|nr:ferro-O2-oxidoreductase [Blastomyces gilchristii SLH14081]OAT11018.1 ferro-O2-oxidoreductase [Blastomyces gilchristii SLH14081]